MAAKDLLRKMFGRRREQPQTEEPVESEYQPTVEEAFASRPEVEYGAFSVTKKFDFGSHASKTLKNPIKWIFLIVTVALGSTINYLFAGAFVALFFYMLFPNEWRLLNDAERSFHEQFPGGGSSEEWKSFRDGYFDRNKWMTYPKEFSKVMAIILFAIAFYSFNPLLFLVTLLVGYFSFPSGFDEEHPAKKVQVEVKVVLPFLIAASFLVFFQSGILALISFAFFFVLPIDYEKVKLSKNKESKFSEYSVSHADKVIFALIMLAVAGAMYWNGSFWFIEGWGLELRTVLGITMASVWLMSLFAGYSSPPESRAYIGLIMIAITMVAYSSTFPATVGTAIFGAWWPTIDSAITSVTAPLGDAFAQMQESTGSAFSMVTNPTGYFDDQMRKQPISANLKSGGTTRSIDVSDFTFQINNIPEQPLLASATIENRGEFKATNIEVVLKPLQIKSKDGKSGYSPQQIKYKFLSCSGITPKKTNIDEDTCAWPEPSYNGDMKLMTFSYGYDDKWDNLGVCYCINPSGEKKGKCLETDGDPTGCRKCGRIDKTWAEEAEQTIGKVIGEPTSDKCESGETIGYDYAGRTISVGFNYSFKYIVNVSLDLQLMEKDTLNDLLLKKQIRLQDVEAQYSGGPVRASIWTQKQPVRIGEDSLGVITILNQGSGTVKSGAKYTLTVPLVAGMNSDNLKITEVSRSGLACEKPTDKTGYKEVQCTLEKDLEKGADAKYGFIFKYNIENADRKTVLLVGNVNYEYQNFQTKETQITWIPPQ